MRHYIEDVGVDPASKSDTHRWTMVDFAGWAKKQGVVGAAEVESYVKEIRVV